MSTTLQVAGATSVTVGAFIIAAPAGFIIGGIFLILIGISIGAISDF